MIKKDYVVLLHGILRSSKHMHRLARYLEAQGYDVINLNYPSTKAPLDVLADMTWQNLNTKLLENKAVHFVGYSMGGLLIRTLLHKYRPAHLGRVVMLATPNKGSEVADLLQNNRLFKKIYGPAGQQLITNQTAFAHIFGQVDYELGIIAGNSSINPLSSLFIKGIDDGKVSVESTKLEGMKAHHIVKANHTWFPYNRHVQRQTACFLEKGMFEPRR